MKRTIEMAELLDVYDANRKHIGVADRGVVHACGLWHKTVHCWIVLVNGDDAPRLVFQRRPRTNVNSKNAGKLYTTASGHVSAGESLESSFVREIAEEIGLDARGQIKPIFMHEGPWVADMRRNDGNIMIDRVFANVYYAEYGGALSDFKFNDGEVDGVVAINLDDFIEFSKSVDVTKNISGKEFDGNGVLNLTLSVSDFVLNEGEDIYTKFGTIAEKIKNSIK